MRRAKSEFSVGDRVRRVVGCQMSGVVVRPFFWKDSTDGTYKAPEGEVVWVQWDHGTKGWEQPCWLGRA